MHVEKSKKLAFFSVVRREILQGQYGACYSRKETIGQLMAENNVENFIYVPSTEQNKQNQTLCKQKNSSRQVAASPLNKLNG